MKLKLHWLTLQIPLSFGVFWVLLTVLLPIRVLLVFLVSAAVHELTHILYLRYYGVKEITLTLSIGGAAMTGRGFSLLPYRNAVKATVSAPLVNLFLAVLSACLYFAFSKNLCLITATVNLGLCLCNLLPLSFTDGGRALFCLPANTFSLQRAEQIKRTTDCILCAVFIMISVYTGIRLQKPSLLCPFAGYCVFMLLKNDSL